MVTIRLPSPQRIFWVLLAVVCALGAASLAGQISKHEFGHGNLKGLVPLFYVDEEASIPTWYSSAALMLAAVVLAVLGLAKRRSHRGSWAWAALAVLFVLLSIDEVAMIHEYPIEPLRDALHASGPLYYTWVIPGALFVGVVGVCFARFLWNLPSHTRDQFILAGAVFVGGAIGVEMISGWWADRHGEQNLTYASIVTVEEMMEMLGVVIFLRGLTEELQSTLSELVIGWQIFEVDRNVACNTVIISTSTPTGAGNTRETYLNPGDRREVSVVAIGTLVTPEP